MQYLSDCFIAEKDIFHRCITRINSGSVMGYKYFDFGDDYTGDSLTLALNVGGMGTNCILRVLLDGEDGEEIGVCNIGTHDGVYKVKVRNITGRHSIFFRCEHTVEGWMAGYFEGKPLFELKDFVFMK